MNNKKNNTNDLVLLHQRITHITRVVSPEVDEQLK